MQTSLLVPVIFATVLGLSGAAGAQSKCDAGKLKCVGKAKACLLGVEAKALKKGVAVDTVKGGRCLDKLTRCLSKLADKQNPAQPASLCSVTGDTMSLEVGVEAVVDDVLRDVVLDYPLVEPPKKCHAALAKCVAKRCRCLLKAWERALKLGVPVDPAKLEKCANKFFDPTDGRGCVDKAYAKQDPAKPKTLCDVPGGGAGLEGEIDAYVASLLAAVTGAPTPSPTATGTPVPMGTATVTPPPTPVSTMTPVPTRTATVTPPPTPLATMTPIATPTPSGGCPSSLLFDGGDGDAVDYDVGFSGFAHDMSGPMLGPLALGVIDCVGTSPSCGACVLDGPIPNPAGVDTQRCACDSSVLCATSSDCPSGCPCRFFLGPPHPAEVGGFGVCLTHAVAGVVTGTTDLGSGDTVLLLPVETGLTLETVFPPRTISGCPECLGDVTPNDDVQDGACAGGPRHGLPCDAHAQSGLYAAGVSLDCPAPAAFDDLAPGTLALSTGTATLSPSASGPTCRSSGFGGTTCLCDTCASPGFEPCNADSDCPGGAPGSCGGLRCLAGPDHGVPCSAQSDCAAPGLCGHPGEATRPNDCRSGICTPAADHEGECATTFDLYCSPAERFRRCEVDSDCLAPGDTCQAFMRDCFLEDGVTVAGVSSPTTPVLGAVACHALTAGGFWNGAFGLPGPVRVKIPATVTPF